MARAEALERVPLFSACSKRDLRQLAALFDEVEVPEGRALTREGENGREFFVIADGEADVTVRGRRVATIRAGHFFGELALLDQGPRTATVTAKTPMRLYAIHARDFGVLLEDHPSVARKMLRALAERLRRTGLEPPTAS